MKSGLYDGLDSLGMSMPLPNPAPDIEMAPPPPPPPVAAAAAAPAAAAPPLHAQFQLPPSAAADDSLEMEDADAPKKKKYAKEAWPGKKPTPSLLV